MTIIKGKDGHLVSIHNADELQAVRSLLGSSEAGKQFWIGLRMNCPTCSFTWSDHTPVDFEVWRDGEPNNVGGVELGCKFEYLRIIPKQFSELDFISPLKN